jgi:hypothetical protein
MTKEGYVQSLGLVTSLSVIFFFLHFKFSSSRDATETNCCVARWMFQSRVNDYEEESEDDLSLEFGDHLLPNTHPKPSFPSPKNNELYYEEKNSAFKDLLIQICQCFQWKKEGSEAECVRLTNKATYTSRS